MHLKFVNTVGLFYVAIEIIIREKILKLPGQNKKIKNLPTLRKSK